LYEHALDFDRSENAYSAFVTKASMAAEKLAREQERAMKKVRTEEAAKAAAEMREKYRQEAEVKAQAKAEADEAARVERDAANAEKALVADAAAEAAAEAAHQRMETEMREGEAREKQMVAAEETRRDGGGGDDDDDDEMAFPTIDVEPRTPKSAGKRPDATATATTEKKKPKLGRPKGKGDKAGGPDLPKTPTNYVPQFTSKPVKVGGAVVVEMPDDFPGLYAMRVGDDKQRLTAHTAAGHKGGKKKDDTSTENDPKTNESGLQHSYQVELKRLSSDGGVGLLSHAFCLFPGAATIGTVIKLIAKATNIPSDNIRVFSGDTVEDQLEEGTSVADAVYGQIRAGVLDVALRYSVV